MGTLEAADSLYEAGTWNAAAAAYQALQERGAVPTERRQDVELRVCVALGRGEQWDAALEAALAFYQRHAGTVWEVRVLTWLVELYRDLPHEAYQVRDAAGKLRVIRGDGERGLGVPANPDGTTPRSIYCHSHDDRIADSALEAARVRCSELKGLTGAEEAGLCFETAQVLGSGFWHEWDLTAWRADVDPRIDPEAPYDPQWPLPHKLLYLFARIRVIAPSLPDGPLLVAASLLGEAVSLWQYQAHVAEVAEQDEGEGQRETKRYLLEDRNPEGLIDQALAVYPDGELREAALLTRALMRVDRSDFVGAAADLRELLASGADGALQKQAWTQLERITQRELNLETHGQQFPGRPAQVTLSYRNVERVHYTALRFDLQAAYAADPIQYGPDHPTFPGTALTLTEAQRFHGEPVAEGWLDLPHGEAHCFRTETVALPLKEAGAYAVEFRTTGIQITGLVLISDLGLVHIQGRAGGLLFLADRISGVARGECDVLLRGFRYGQKPSRHQLRVGADGLLSLAGGDVRDWDRTEYTALTVKDGHPALTGEVDAPWHDPRGGSSYQVHGVMDRPAYRPGQTVHYRLLLMQREGGWWKPAARKRVTFRVEDPSGSVVEETQLPTNEWGVASGELTLPPDAPLGFYLGRIIGLGRGRVADCRFRVEEYRKPEFSVSVTPMAERVRPGEPASVEVQARYYWGAPVSGAEVSYRIYREPYRPRSPFPPVWMPDEEYPSDPSGIMLGVRGSARTDAGGNAEIRFDTHAVEAGDPDETYRIEVEVRDASRRVIAGAALLRVRRRSLFLFTRCRTSYVTPGEPVEVEVAARDAAGRPAPAAGSLRIYRQLPPAPGKENPREEQVEERGAEIGPQGTAVFRWTSVGGGSYRVSFEAPDPEAGEEVSASACIWVRGATGGAAPDPGLALRPEYPSYREGEPARILVTAPREQSTVLLLRVIGKEIREHQLLDVPTGEREVEVALGPDDVPNVQFRAVCLRDGHFHEAQCELFVRPAMDELQVEVSAAQERCRPGETARLQVRTRDGQDRPVEAELSLAVSDAALSYIQSRLTRPIHAVFTPRRREHAVHLAASPDLRLAARGATPGGSDGYETVGFETPPPLRALPAWTDDAEGMWYSISVYYRFHPEEPRGRYAYVTSKRRLGTGAPCFGRLAEVPAGGGVAEVKKKKAESRSTANVLISDYDPVDEPPSEPDAGPIRHQFADTAFWSSAVRTDAAGEAVVELVWPDNLTEWQVHAVGNTRAGEVGEGEMRVQTAQEVLVRPQAPRFLVEGDEAVLSAVVHNYLDVPLQGAVSIQLDGGGLELRDSSPRRELSVPPEGEVRVDWWVRARQPGPERIRMGFQAEGGGDAAEARLPVLVRGARIAVTHAGELRDGTATHARDRIIFRLPEASRPGSARLVVRTAPSLLALALDALPYLIDYPYGCIEQTVSRFVPAVLAGEALTRLGVNLETFVRMRETAHQRVRALGGPAPVEYTPYTYPEVGKRDLPSRVGPPAVTHAALKQTVQWCLRRLASAQNGDGGWGWWPRYPSSLEMTAYVVDGLQEADRAGWSGAATLVDSGGRHLADRLRDRLDDESGSSRLDLHTLVRTAAVLVRTQRHRELARRVLAERAFAERERLTPHGLAQLALALRKAERGAEAEQVLNNLLDQVRTDPHAGTAWWSRRQGETGYFSRPETSAAALRAIQRLRSGSPLGPMVARWLALNRRGMAWHSTRESALVIQALLEYAGSRGELAADYTLTLSLNGSAVSEQVVRGAESVVVPVLWDAPAEMLPAGEQELVLEKAGTGALYYGATLEYFSTESDLQGAGHGFTVRRHYFRKHLVSDASPEFRPGVIHPRQEPRRWQNPFLSGDLSLLTPEEEVWQPRREEPPAEWKRIPLKQGEAIRSGELLEVEVTLEAENEIGYLLLEDIKPAGCEAEDRNSGPCVMAGLLVHRELRDQKVAFFLERVPQGRTTLSYQLRAEAPGVFTALPSLGYAMYAPELQAVGAGCTLEIHEESS